VAALRSSDMSSYISLLQQTKNKRLQEVLAQTDACLGQIAAKVAAATQGRAAQAGGTGGWWNYCLVTMVSNFRLVQLSLFCMYA
jgi:hypothetical protein